MPLENLHHFLIHTLLICIWMPWAYLCARMLPRLYKTQGIQENCTVLGYYTASSGNSLPTFRDNLSVPSSRVKYPRIAQKRAVLTYFVAEAWHQRHTKAGRWCLHCKMLQSSCNNRLMHTIYCGMLSCLYLTLFVVILLKWVRNLCPLMQPHRKTVKRLSVLKRSRHHPIACLTRTHYCYLPYSSLGQEYCNVKFIVKLEKSSHPAFNIRVCKLFTIPF